MQGETIEMDDLPEIEGGKESPGIFRRLFGPVIRKILGIGGGIKSILGHLFTAGFWRGVADNFLKDIYYAGLGAFGSRLVLIARGNVDATLGSVERGKRISDEEAEATVFTNPRANPTVSRPASSYNKSYSVANKNDDDWHPYRHSP